MILLIIILAIALQVYLTVKKVSPFLSLLIVAILTGFALGMTPEAILKSVKQGSGDTAGSVLLVLCLGAGFGKILEAAGAAEKVASVLIRGFGKKHIQLAVLLTGFLIGIPLYYNAGFVILVPLIFSVVRRTQLPLLYIAIPMAASLSATHCFLPPHPGPVFLVGAFKADMGKTLLYGLLIAVPAVIIAGPLLGRILKRINVTVSHSAETAQDDKEGRLPPALPSFIIALLPVLLITLAVMAENFLKQESLLQKALLFTGDSTVALLIAVIAASGYFGWYVRRSVDISMQWLTTAFSGIAGILLIIIAGGVFKQVLTDSGTGAYIASFSDRWQMPPLLFTWTLTALLRVAIGSATVAGITAASVVAPLAVAGNVSPELMVLAVGTGSVFGSHINDSGFWMFKEFFKLSLKQTFLSWTIMETIISVVGLLGVLLLNALVEAGIL